MITDKFIMRSSFVLLIGLASASAFRISPASENARIDVLDVRTQVQSRFATTVVKSVIANTGDDDEEVKFSVILPANAFVSNLILLVDGKLVVGEVEENEVVPQASRSFVQPTRDTNQFDIAVTVTKENSVTLKLTYEEILERVHSLYKHVFYLQAPTTIPTLRVHTTIREYRKITKVVVPEIGDRVGEKTNKELNKVKNDATVNIDQIDTDEDSTVNVYYRPTIAEQEKLKVDKREDIRAQITILYDVARTKDCGELLVADGYFVHFFAPSVKTRQPKRIVFVIDVSGSMSGKKLSQTIEAMQVILDDLTSADTFNIAIFDTGVFIWNAGFRPYKDVADAKKYVRSLVAHGGTNIQSAMLKAISLFDKPSKKKADMIVFMTDGQAGVNVNEIKNALNGKNIIVHTIAFGRGADFNLLKKIALVGNGLAKQIYEDSDSAAQMEGFYAQVGNPLMTNVDIQYQNVTLEQKSIQQDIVKNYNEGGEIVVVGKLDDDAVATNEVMTGVVDGDSAAGHKVLRCMPPPCSMIRCDSDTCTMPPWCRKSSKRPTSDIKLLNSRNYNGFIQRMWAYRSIKKMLQDLDESDKDALTKFKLEGDVVDMSLKYNYVTAFTHLEVDQKNAGSPFVSTISKSRIRTKLLPDDPTALLGGSLSRPSIGSLGSLLSGGVPSLSGGVPSLSGILSGSPSLSFPTSLGGVLGGRGGVGNCINAGVDKCPCSYPMSCEKIGLKGDKYACCSG